MRIDRFYFIVFLVLGALLFGCTQPTYKGCAYDNPTCGQDHLCTNNTCVLRQGCQYANPSCSPGYDCISNDCVLSERDPLNKINSLFNQADYSQQGFMYYAADLYKEGLFPSLPYLTPIKNQGNRGNCWAFTQVAAAEIFSLNRPDLSEQNYVFWRYATGRPAPELGVPIGLESEWPYNPALCKAPPYYEGNSQMGEYVVSGQTFPCGLPDVPSPSWTDGKHSSVSGNTVTYTGGGIPSGTMGDGQGIIVDDTTIQSYVPINSKFGRCMIGQSLNIDHPTDKDMEKIITLLIDLRYLVGVDIYNMNEISPQGFVHGGITESSQHEVLLIGFVPNAKVPNEVKQNPYYSSGEVGYFIAKNSATTGSGDYGFIYFPYSWLKANMWSASEYRYDVNSTIYQDCPKRPDAGVPTDIPVGDSPCKSGFDCYTNQLCNNGFCQNS